MSSDTMYDVVIVGSGISGINAACRLQEQCPGLRYTVLEARNAIGGTWSFFKYPGLRSDSDLYTYGFPFKPWVKTHPIAEADSILEYLNETVQERGIQKHIQFDSKVSALNWSSEQQTWRLDVNGESRRIYTRFLILGTGYYSYDAPLKSPIPGLDTFKGTVLHTQTWPEDFDYAGKKVVIVGSGATAITMLPVVAKKAGSATMLQRSPSYVVPIGMKDKRDQQIRSWLPTRLARTVIWYKHAFTIYSFYWYCMYFPNKARILVIDAMRKLMPNVDVDKHFSPKYTPWKQRLCFAPDGDFHKALNDGKANVVTDHIKTIDAEGIQLESGDRLDADIIVTATGLQVRMLGGASLTVDGKKVDMSEKHMWRGCMFDDVPNLVYGFGYSNNSWTPGSDICAQTATRLIKELNRRGKTSVAPYWDATKRHEERSLLELSSTYTKSGDFPMVSNLAEWGPRNNVLWDYIVFWTKGLDNCLKWSYVRTD